MRSFHKTRQSCLRARLSLSVSSEDKLPNKVTNYPKKKVSCYPFLLYDAIFLTKRLNTTFNFDVKFPTSVFCRTQCSLVEVRDH